MMSGCSQGSHIFEVVFIRDRRQPTFTIVAEVNGSFFLFSQCPCHSAIPLHAMNCHK